MKQAAKSRLTKYATSHTETATPEMLKKENTLGKEEWANQSPCAPTR